ncbi:MAG: class I SAM-dependent methyltransferase [Methanobacteriaceae archaeon]
MDDKNYWENYYKSHFDPVSESSFAKFVMKYIEKDKRLIELGCGNGRDSVYFANKGLFVLGVDQVQNEINYLNNNHSTDKLNFLADDFTNLGLNEEFDYVYSRFTFHSINEERENRTINWIKSNLKPKGLFFLEARSIKDSMYNKGKKLSQNENFTDHYRRYMDLGKILKKLNNENFKIIHKTESNGLAVFKDDNPVVIRIVARLE